MKPGLMLFILIIIFSLVLMGCNYSQTVTPTSVDPTVEETLTIPPTDLPTATTPPPAIVVLVISEESDPLLVEELQSVLQDMILQAGMQFRTTQALTEQDFQQDKINVVIALHAQDELEAWAKLAPQTQFLAVGGRKIEPLTNLSVISSLADSLALKTFLAGYIAAMITPDWRVAILTDVNDARGETLRQVFINGAHFFCGLCRSVYPPYPIPGYPLYMEISTNATPADLESAIEYFRTWHVKTIFIAPPLDSDELLQALSQAGFNLIAGRKPPVGLLNGWVVSIVDENPVPMILALYPEMVAGEGGKSMHLTLEMQVADSSLFTPGKQNMAAELLADLLAGFVDIGIEP